MRETNPAGTINLRGAGKHKEIRILFTGERRQFYYFFKRVFFFLSDIGAYFETVSFKYGNE